MTIKEFATSPGSEKWTQCANSRFVDIDPTLIVRYKICVFVKDIRKTEKELIAETMFSTGKTQMLL